MDRQLAAHQRVSSGPQKNCAHKWLLSGRKPGISVRQTNALPMRKEGDLHNMLPLIHQRVNWLITLAEFGPHKPIIGQYWPLYKCSCRPLA